MKPFNRPAAASMPEAGWRLLDTILFGNGGNDAFHLGIGWAGAGDRFRWLAGTTSEVWLEHPGASAYFVLELDLQADPTDSTPHTQRLSVNVRGTVIGRSVLSGRRRLRYHVPAEIVAGKGPIRVSLQHEDAAPRRPNAPQTARVQAPLRCYGLQLWHAPEPPETRHLEPGSGLAVADLPRLTGQQADALVCMFESLGDNCEFGIVQRLCGAEPLGLLRWGAPRLPRLLECLRTRFEHFGAIENLDFTLGDTPRREYTVHEKRYRMAYHTFLYKNEIDESQLLVKQAARLKFLVRNLLDDLEEGQKILVWKDTSGQATETDAKNLHAELATFAENTLLWVTTADEEHKPGSVEWIAVGLLKGYVHRFSYPVPEVDLPPWLEVCVNAYLLVQEQKTRGGGTVRLPQTAAPRPRVSAPPLLPAPAVAHGMAHVQNRGDVYAGADGWIGVPGSGKAIEGMMILDDPAISYRGLTYQVLLADGSLSEPAPVGIFRGTRGKNQPARGVIFTLTEERAKSVQVSCEARFVDGEHLHDVTSGTVCEAASGSALEAIRLTLEPLC